MNPLLLPELKEMVRDKSTDELREFLTRVHPAQAADLIDGLDLAEVSWVLEILPNEQEAQIFPYLPERLQAELAHGAARSELAKLLDELPPDPFDFGYLPHHTLCYPERPDRAYLGYIDGGIVILDISDKAHPRLISRLDYHPPFPGFTHTVLPLFDRNLLVVTDEATGDKGIDWPKRLWLVDVRVETNPVMIASMPTPEGFEELHRIGGRIGAHNVHENRPEPGCARLQNTVVATWFSAGLRIYDIADPFRPEEIAAFLPETPEGQRGCRISDVFVDDRGIIYAADRARGGLYILEYTGTQPLN
jgi:hypothetical protein